MLSQPDCERPVTGNTKNGKSSRLEAREQADDDRVAVSWVQPDARKLYLEAYGSGKDIFHIDPLGWVVAGIAGPAVARMLGTVAALQKPFQR